MEVRYIIFSPDEVTTAVAKLLCQRYPKFDPNSIRRTEVTETEDKSLACMVSMQAAAGSGRVEIEPSELLRAMLLFCRHQRIPLSVRAEKRLEVVPGGVALVGIIHPAEDEPKVTAATVRATLVRARPALPNAAPATAALADEAAAVSDA